MTDLDLDAIRERLALVMRTRSFGTVAFRLGNVDVPALLAEVGRLRREQSIELANAEARADVLAEQVARLEANQLPDGGEWLQRDGGWMVDGEFQRWISGSFAAPTHRRRVWTGPVESIPSESKSEPRSDVDPADDTQTPHTAV